MCVQRTIFIDICKVEGCFGILLLSFVYFCEDIPDDGRTTQACNMIVCEGEFLQQI